MRKSNLFIKLQSDYGTFYTFSEYAETLTRNIAEGDAFRLVPSKFAAFDIDYNNITIDQPSYPGQADDIIGNIFQDYFENCINIFRQANSEGWTYTPEIAKHKLYETLNEFHFTTPVEETIDDTVFTYWPELKYVGDVDIVSNAVTEGINYSELYCMIPNSATANKYFLDPIHTETAPDVDYASLQDYISGWNQSTYPTAASALDHTPLFDDINGSYTGYNLSECWYPKILFNNNSDTNIENAPYEPSDEDPFYVNTIIIYYDIVVKDSEGNYNTIYYNIPFGIYFTGSLSGSNSSHESMTNYITKYVNTEEAYNQGTSYGLRITTKATVMPAFGTETNIVDVEVENLYPEFARVCEGFLESIHSMNEMTSQSTEYLNTLKDYLAYFKDKRTNVPYIMNLGTQSQPAYYWFVNGRNTGVRIADDQDLLTQIANLSTRVLQLEEEVDSLYPDYTNFSPDYDLQSPNIQNEPVSNNTPVSNTQNIPEGFNITGMRRLPASYIKDFTNKASVTRINEFYDICPLYDDDAVELFDGYTSLLAIPKLDLFNITTADHMFRDCENLRSADLSDSVSAETFIGCFDGCSSLVTVRIDMTSIVRGALTDIFKGCSSLENIYIDNLKIPGNMTPITLDLSDTICSTNSLIYILEHIQTERYTPDQTSYHLIIRLPQNLDADSKEIQDALYLVTQNKHVEITLS